MLPTPSGLKGGALGGFPGLEFSVIKPPPVSRTKVQESQVPRPSDSCQPGQEENLKNCQGGETTVFLTPVLPRASLEEAPTPKTAEGFLDKTAKYTQHCLQSMV